MRRPVLLLVAFLATLYASASFACHFDADFEVSAVVALICLGGVFGSDYIEHERRRRMAGGRAEVWARRDREAGQR